VATQTRKKALSPEDFYRTALDALTGSSAPFLVGGAYALRTYSGIQRETKDLDVFCKAGDYPRLLAALAAEGFETELTNPNWLAKARLGEYYVDIIFNSANRLCLVDDTWFEQARDCDLLNHQVKLVPAEEMIWSKSMVQDRFRFDGADVAHIIRQEGETLDWRRLLNRMEALWEVLFEQIMLFRFVYPADREKVPRWLVQELLNRVTLELDLPRSHDRVCRGRILSRSQYETDYEEWGYKPT